jgi:hypothetical protein
MIGGDVEDKWRRLKEIAMFLIFHILFIGNNYLKSSELVFLMALWYWKGFLGVIICTNDKSCFWLRSQRPWLRGLG